jgi:hypothetical protein
MLALITTHSSLLVCRFRTRAALELEVVALRHQLAVLRRQRPVSFVRRRARCDGEPIELTLLPTERRVGR